MLAGSSHGAFLMFRLLDHRSGEAAEEIRGLFRRSYRVEAELIGAEDFPPLGRTTEDIRGSGSRFLGAFDGPRLVAVVEYTLDDGHLSVDNLAVDPACFRRGWGRRLLAALFDSEDWRTASIETAAANRPAIALYEKAGFALGRRWQTGEGIEKVALALERARRFDA